MARRYYSSTAVATTLASGTTNSGTTLTVTSLTGYPAQTPWTAIIDEGTASEEVVTVTNVAGTTLTVTRGVDGTSSVSHNAGASFKHGVSARDFEEPNAFVNTMTTKGDLLAQSSSGVVRLAAGTNGYRLEAASSETAGVKWSGDPVCIVVAVSDETTTITTGTAKVTFRMPWAMTVTSVRASLTTASSSGNPTFDINESGASILGSNKLSIDANEKTSTTAATATTISDASLADDSEITIDVDAAGSGAKGAKIYLIGVRA